MLFEFGNYHILQNTSRKEIEAYLQEVWLTRNFAYFEQAESSDQEEAIQKDRKYQPFLQFDGQSYRARNYVGFIQFENELIEIYPKVFRDQKHPDKELIMRHLFFWLSYCRKFSFPFTDASLNKLDSATLPELLIYLFTHQCFEIVSRQPYSAYLKVEEVLQTPRGRIDFKAYSLHGLSTGNYHQIDCVHEPFSYDNQLNRTIKYVCRLLLSLTRHHQTQSLLQQICFMLDEVEDTPCSVHTLEQVKLNAIYSDYEPLVEWCKRFLQHQVYNSQSYTSKQWSLLLPMEYVFEDFIAGFMERHFGADYSVELQKSNLYLTNEPNQAFNLQHDILLTRKGRGPQESIIIDTKYKLRTFDKGDPKRGVAQADMYQITSYAYRRGCRKVILIYPNHFPDFEKLEEFDFVIPAGRSGGGAIEVKVLEVPFWSNADVTLVENNLKMSLERSVNSFCNKTML